MVCKEEVWFCGVEIEKNREFFLLFSGLISQDKNAIKEAVTSVRRNGVGLKGKLLRKWMSVYHCLLHLLLA